MNDKCPNCSQEIKIGESQLIDCPKCNIKILSVTINGEKKLMDVTPKEDLSK